MEKKRFRFTLCVIAATSTRLRGAKTFETLLIFDNTDGANPCQIYPLVRRNRRRKTYGTTLVAGTNGSGDGVQTRGTKVTTLYNSGTQPNAQMASSYGGLDLERWRWNLYGNNFSRGEPAALVPIQNHPNGI